MLESTIWWGAVWRTDTHRRRQNPRRRARTPGNRTWRLRRSTCIATHDQGPRTADPGLHGADREVDQAGVRGIPAGGTRRGAGDARQDRLASGTALWQAWAGEADSRSVQNSSGPAGRRVAGPTNRARGTLRRVGARTGGPRRRTPGRRTWANASRLWAARQAAPTDSRSERYRSSTSPGSSWPGTTSRPRAVCSTSRA
jgi:hypothetical protein